MAQAKSHDEESKPTGGVGVKATRKLSEVLSTESVATLGCLSECGNTGKAAPFSTT